MIKEKDGAVLTDEDGKLKPYWVINLKRYGNSVLPNERHLTPSYIKRKYGLDVSIRVVKESSYSCLVPGNKRYTMIPSAYKIVELKNG